MDNVPNDYLYLTTPEELVSTGNLPLVWALQLIPASIAAGIIVVFGFFGLVWVGLGYRL